MLKKENWILYRKYYFYPLFMRVKFVHTGAIISANTNTELVEKLSEGGHVQSSSVFDYMKKYAQRAVNFYNHDIRFTSVDDFISDLKLNRHIEIIED